MTFKKIKMKNIAKTKKKKKEKWEGVLNYNATISKTMKLIDNLKCLSDYKSRTINDYNLQFGLEGEKQ